MSREVIIDRHAPDWDSSGTRWLKLTFPGRYQAIHISEDDYELLCLAVIRDVLRRKPELIFDNLVDQEPEP